MGMQHEDSAWKCGKDKQQGHAAWKYRMDMQQYMLHGHTWTFGHAVFT
jgi:hypothetical protein